MFVESQAAMGGGGSAQMGRSCARHRNFPTQHYQWLGPYRGLCSYPAKPPPPGSYPQATSDQVFDLFLFYKFRVPE